VNPNPGTLTLSGGWTTTADGYIGAVSFKSTDTVTGINAAHTVSASNQANLAVTSDANGATVVVFGVNGSLPTLNFNKIWDNAPLDPGGGSSYQLGGTSNDHTFTGAGGSNSSIAGIHIISA
jgi:hypothetical protein